MKKMLFAFVGVLFFVNLTNAGPLDLITSKYKLGQITADQYYLNLYYYLYNPALVDLNLIPNPQEKITCAADIPTDYQNEINLVSNSVRSLISTVEADGIAEADQSYISPSGYFSINYNPGKLTVADQADINNNGYPDLIEQIGVWFDSAKNKLIDQAGFKSPLSQAELTLGLKYAVFLPGSNTTHRDINFPGGSYITLLIYPSKMMGNDPMGARLGEIKAGIAHEFKHAIQLATDNWGTDLFYPSFKHLDACWAEEFVFDESNSAYSFVGSQNSFSKPSLGLFNHVDGKQGSFFVASNVGYSDFLWHVFIHERYESNSGTQAPLLKAFWEDRSAHPLDRLETSYNRIFLPLLGENATGKLVCEYFIWNYFTSGRSIINSTGNIAFGYHDALLNTTNDLNLPVKFPEVLGSEILTHSITDIALPVTYTGGNIMMLENPLGVSHFYIKGSQDPSGNFGAVGVRSGSTLTVYFVPLTEVPIEIPTGDEMILTGNFYSDNPIQPFVNFEIGTTTLNKVQTVIKNQISNLNAGGKLKLLDLNLEVSSGSSVPLFLDYTYLLKTLETGFPVSNPVNLRHHWNNDNINYNQTEVFLADGTPQSANFFPSYQATIESRIEGVLPVFTNFSDPWVTGGIGLTDKVSGTRKVFPNEEKDPIKPLKPYYMVKADQVLTFAEDQTAQFQNWKTTGTDQLTNSESAELQPVVFRSANATVYANYKSKLKTGQPANSNSKNQRRLAVNGNTQLLVYESMSDIWVTASFDDGVTWLPEKRVTKRTGYAANPSLSALITSGSALKGLVTWSEVNSSGQTETYLQSITLSASQLYFGWASLVSAPADNTNRRKLNDFGFSTLPQAGAAPTLSLSGSSVVIAYKGTNAYLIGGKFTVGSDLNSISGLVTRNLSTDNTSKQANVIHLDANSGFGAKDFVYYAKSNGSSEPVYQYDWDAQTTLQCDIPAPTGTGQYSCESLQASGSNGTVTFVYQGAASSGPDVLYYVKAGYNDRPVLSVRYLKGEKPAVTDQATSAYSVTGRLVFRSTDPANSGNWFSVVGSGSATSIGNLAVGMYTRDQGTGSSFMFTSNETPLASVKRYTGSGQLMKGDDGIQMNYTFNRWWVDQNGVKHPVVLDFTGVTVEPEGSMEQGNVICAVKVVNPSDEEILVSQPDTLVNNLAISIFRNGQVIRAYKPTAWSEISTQNLTGLMPDDILLFSVPETVTFSLGFTDVELKPADGMNKRVTKEKSMVDLAAVNNEIAVYPNPFNPVTTLTVSVNTPSLVSIQVFNILGQVVADFGRNQMGAGKHSVQFDGKTLASGTYFYRVEIGNEVKTGKLQLLK